MRQDLDPGPRRRRGAIGFVAPADVPTPALVAIAALCDARLFADEFPRQQLGTSDWDVTAWAETSRESLLSDRVTDTNEGDLWEIYRAVLVAEIARLARA